MAVEITIVKSLLQGNHIKQRHGNKHPYCVYDARLNPLFHISRSVWKKLYPITKKDKKGRITLNLNLVRQLHGNDTIKKEYKLIYKLKKQQQNAI